MLKLTASIQKLFFDFRLRLFRTMAKLSRPKFFGQEAHGSNLHSGGPSILVIHFKAEK
jgi:hypothetical protein